MCLFVIESRGHTLRDVTVALIIKCFFCMLIIMRKMTVEMEVAVVVTSVSWKEIWVVVEYPEENVYQIVDC